MRYRDSNAVFFLRADALWRVQISLPALNSAGSWTYCIRQCSPLQVTDELKRSVKGGLIRLIHLLKRPPRKQSQTHWHDILRMVKSRHMLLTSGCISDCISASCTALGTWNLSISSIIVVTRVFLPLLEKLRFPNVKKKLSICAQIRDNIPVSPVMSYIPADSMSAVVWAVGWRRLHHPLPGGGSQDMVPGGGGGVFFLFLSILFFYVFVVLQLCYSPAKKIMFCMFAFLIVFLHVFLGFVFCFLLACFIAFAVKSMPKNNFISDLSDVSNIVFVSNCQFLFRFSGFWSLYFLNSQQLFNKALWTTSK